jgi:hypothetical protein
MKHSGVDLRGGVGSRGDFGQRGGAQGLGAALLARGPLRGLRCGARPWAKSPRPQTLRPATPATGWVREGVEHPVGWAFSALGTNAGRYYICSCLRFINKRQRHFLLEIFRPNPWWFQVGVGSVGRSGGPQRTGWAAHMRSREAQGGGRHAQRASWSDPSRLFERSAQRARSEFRDAPPTRASQGTPPPGGASIQAAHPVRWGPPLRPTEPTPT